MDLMLGCCDENSGSDCDGCDSMPCCILEKGCSCVKFTPLIYVSKASNWMGVHVLWPLFVYASTGAQALCVFLGCLFNYYKDDDYWCCQFSFLWWHFNHDRNETSTVSLFPPFCRENRDGRRRIFILVPPIYWRSGLDIYFLQIVPLFGVIINHINDSIDFNILCYLFRVKTSEKSTVVWLLPFFTFWSKSGDFWEFSMFCYLIRFRKYDDHGFLFTVLPFVWIHSRLANGDKKFTMTLLPILTFHSTDDNYVFVSALYWQFHGSRGTNHFIVPLLLYWHNYGESKFFFCPFWLWRKGEDYVYHYMLPLPLFVYHRTGHSKMIHVLPLFSWRKPVGDSVGWFTFLFLFWYLKQGKRSWLLLFIFYYHAVRSHEILNRAVLFLILLKYDWRGHIVGFHFLWPLIHVEWGDDGNSVRVMPLYWHRKTSYTFCQVLFPFYVNYRHLKKGDARFDHWLLIFPLALLHEQQNSTWCYGSPGLVIPPYVWVWRQKESESSQTFIIPLFTRWCFGGNKETSFLWPLFRFWSSEEKIGCHILLFWYCRNKLNDETVITLYPFFWATKTKEATYLGVLLIFPYPFYESRFAFFRFHSTGKDTIVHLWPFFYILRAEDMSTTSFFWIFADAALIYKGHLRDTHWFYIAFLVWLGYSDDGSFKRLSILWFGNSRSRIISYTKESFWMALVFWWGFGDEIKFSILWVTTPITAMIRYHQGEVFHLFPIFWIRQKEYGNSFGFLWIGHYRLSLAGRFKSSSSTYHMFLPLWYHYKNGDTTLTLLLFGAVAKYHETNSIYVIGYGILVAYATSDTFTLVCAGGAIFIYRTTSDYTLFTMVACALWWKIKDGIYDFRVIWRVMRFTCGGKVCRFEIHPFIYVASGTDTEVYLFLWGWGRVKRDGDNWVHLGWLCCFTTDCDKCWYLD
ncbi:hypothetical protein Pelo_1363 [Pelomyxa schiedti]|nr:hypothetical protein Pelo_1363 [Pelomyxa schiedti]